MVLHNHYIYKFKIENVITKHVESENLRGFGGNMSSPRILGVLEETRT